MLYAMVNRAGVCGERVQAERVQAERVQAERVRGAHMDVTEAQEARIARFVQCFHVL